MLGSTQEQLSPADRRALEQTAGPWSVKRLQG